MFGFTKCGKCEGAAFKLQEVNVNGAAYRMYAIQCTSCQTPIGVTEYFDNGSLLKKQEKAIADLGQKISHIENAVNQIAYALQSLRR
ncbi:hypothetical protein [Nitrobacter sp.]|uniref:hypothetical protein n=1 Tax=Nitrobacter sp. TaxID=29420 RepID=UPI003F650BE4